MECWAIQAMGPFRSFFEILSRINQPFSVCTHIFQASSSFYVLKLTPTPDILTFELSETFKFSAASPYIYLLKEVKMS